MADNILTKDRDDAEIDIAAKDVGGVLFPRNMLVDAAGADVTPLTDAQLRAAAVPVSLASVPTHGVTGTFWQATQPVSFTWAGLTDAQLRATPVPVSGTFWQATQPVSFTWAGLTDTELRASPLPTSVVGELVEAVEAMRMALQAMTRTFGMVIPDTFGRMRVNVETGANVAITSLPTLATVTTVATLSNQTSLGGFASNDQIPALVRISADALRYNITVT